MATLIEQKPDFTLNSHAVQINYIIKYLLIDT